MPKPHHQKVGHEAGVAAVAIPEWMNLHQPVMEAHRDLVEWIGLVFDPCFRVVEQLAHRHGNLKEGNPDIAFTCSEFTGPAPYIAEHRRCRSLTNFSLSRSRLRPSAQSCAREMFSCSAAFNSRR